MHAFMLAAALSPANLQAPNNALEAYLKLPQTVQSLRQHKDGAAGHFVLTSQTWQGSPWEHDILLKQPPANEPPTDCAILFITGDGPRPGDQLDLNLISGATKLPVVMLFDVPNQPLWDMKEDDLIAHTFEKYLQTGDATWPLLFPMTRSAVAAMDEITRLTANTDRPIRRFVVTGASKRGWTTWLSAASGDPRIVGIAPLVFDNLNFEPQMKHQIEQWGAYSEQIEDYTRRGLQAKLATPEGRKLMQMVDPFSYRRNIKVPTMIVNGANDAYWTADATAQYWNALRQSKWVVNVPNAGHSLGNKIQAVESVSAFARSLARKVPFPKSPAGKFDTKKRTYDVKFEAADVSAIRLWYAYATNTDFRTKAFRSVASLVEPGAASVRLEPFRDVPAGNNVAFFAEVRYRKDGREFSLTTPTVVAKSGR